MLYKSELETHAYFAAVVPLAIATSATYPSRLVPSRREIPFERRSLWQRDIIPTDHVVVNYASSPHHPPSATVSFTAHDDQPIILLEDFDYLLHRVSCPPNLDGAHSNVMHLDFVDPSALEATVDQWESLRQFAVISSHMGCNAEDERGAWIVSSVNVSSLGRRVTLAVDSVNIREIVKAFAVKYKHNGASSWAVRDVLGLPRRDEHGTDAAFNFGYNPNIDARLPLFPPNQTLNNGLPDLTTNQLIDASINMTCVDCSFTTNVTIGMDFEVDIADASCITGSHQSCFTFNKAAMNFTIDQFQQEAALEIVLGASLQAGANYKVLWIPVAPALDIPSLIDLGPAVGIEVAFDFDISASINFTFGAKSHVPSGAFASVSLINTTGDWDPQASASGWDASGIEQIPLRVNGGQFNISSSAAFAPYAEIQFTVLDVGAALRIIQNMPMAGVSASLQNSVNRDCASLGPDDFESFGTAFAVTSGLTLSTQAQLVLETGEFVNQSIPDHWDFTLWNHNIPFSPSLSVNETSCFVLADDDVTVSSTNLNATRNGVNATLIGLPKPTGTLLAAGSAIPTWNITKIESYYSANGHLPTNVNYGQMLQATSVPANIQSAVTQAATSSPPATTATSHSNGSASVKRISAFLTWVIIFVSLVL